MIREEERSSEGEKAVHTMMRRNVVAVFVTPLLDGLNYISGSPQWIKEYTVNKVSEAAAYVRAEMTKSTSTTKKENEVIEEKRVDIMTEIPATEVGKSEG